MYYYWNESRMNKQLKYKSQACTVAAHSLFSSKAEVGNQTMLYFFTSPHVTSDFVLKIRVKTGKLKSQNGA